MMNKKIYQKNLQELVITDEMCVAEAKTVIRKRKALENKVQEAVKEYVRQVANKDYSSSGGYVFVFPQFKLKRTGSVHVRVEFDASGWGDFAHAFTPNRLMREEYVKLSDIMR